jgi:excisionase family DNA binding protein
VAPILNSEIIYYEKYCNSDARVSCDSIYMVTLNLEEAAELLKIHPSTLQAKAASGEIPAAKPGKRWVFIESDLFDWLRTQYTNSRQDVSKEKVIKCSLKEKKSGITSSASKERLYIDLLAPATKRKQEQSRHKLTQMN